MRPPLWERPSSSGGVVSDLCLIFNGDDYGRAPSINAAIIRAYEEGVLTSASLMVTGDAVDEAVAQACDHPGLAVGLHLALNGAGSVLPGNPILTGILCFFSPAVRSQLRAEITAQLERFIDTGLPLSHVDGHYLLHLHPTVFAALLPLAEQYGFRGIRLPRDDLRLALRLDRAQAATKATWASIYALLCRVAERRLKGSPVAYTDRVYGFLQTGRMHEGFVVGLLRRIPATVSSAELYFHPSTQTWDEPYGPNPGDLAALLSPRVRRAVHERRARLTNYAALAVSGHRRMACPGHYCS